MRLHRIMNLITQCDKEAFLMLCATQNTVTWNAAPGKTKSTQWWILWNTSSCAPITLCHPPLKIKQQTYFVTKVTTVLSTFSHHEKEGGSFWGFFQILILKHAAGMSNYYFFKSKFLLPRLTFFIPSHGNFSKVCRQKTHCSGWSRWHNKICDRLKIPHTRT